MKRNIFRYVATALANMIVFFILFSSAYSLSVIPNEDGFGMDTPAGRGGDVYKVTNLNPSGVGSLKECVDATGPRVCVFEVSGTIELTSHLKVTNPYLTIAGQTAPSPGITIKGAGIVVQASDVLIQHIRVRVGDLPNGPAYDDRDAIKIESKYGDVQNVVIDHVSASWATDEVFSTWSYDGRMAENITVVNSIFSEGLYNSYHPDGRHSMGMLIGKNTKDLLLNRNILAFNNYRNPLIRDDSTDVVVANNYIYNPGVGSKSKIYFGTTGSQNVDMRATVVGNVFTPNPNEYYDNMVYIESGSATIFDMFLDDNSGPLGTNDDWGVVMGRIDSSVRASSEPVSVPSLSYLASSDVSSYLYQNAGARPADRDLVDERIITSMQTGIGNIIDSQNDVGGWPVLAENYREFVVPANPSGDDDEDGYTNLEEVLHEHSAIVEGRIVEEIVLPAPEPIPEPNPEPEVNVSADTTPPVILSVSPSIDLELGTTEVLLEVVTDEVGYCHYDDEPNLHYLDMSWVFDNVNTQNHNALITGLVDGQIYTYYIRCKDMNNPHNYNMEDYVVTFSVNVEPVVVDTAPPVIELMGPISSLPAGTTSVNLNVVTDEVAYCHYDDEPNQHYLDMSWVFDNVNTPDHNVVIDGLVDGASYTYYVRCKDMTDPHNYNMEDFVVSFSVEELVPEPEPIDTAPPVIELVNPIGNLLAGTTSVNLEIVTDERAYCHYDNEADEHYLDMSWSFDNTISTEHSTRIDGLKDGRSYIYYVRCKDFTDPHNYNMEDYVVTFKVDKPARGKRR